MDSLAGYGSDDSHEDTPQQHASALSALAAYDDDDDDDDDNDDEEEEIIEDVHPPQKKFKSASSTEPQSTTVASENRTLPPPPLGNHSLILSTVDHFSSRYGSTIHHRDSKVPMPLKLQQLQLLQRTSGSKAAATNKKNHNNDDNNPDSCWAEELKSQHDFCNPALFQTAVQNFGIHTVLGSNMMTSYCQENATTISTMEDYEFDLVRLEEEARLRQQQQHVAIASPTPFAQEQLERAMQVHRRL